MRVVHKFMLYDATGSETYIVQMDKNAIVRRVGSQYGRWQLWAEVDPNAPKVDHVFHVYGTGWPILIGDEYVGTFTQEDERGTEYVWHVYKVVGF